MTRPRSLLGALGRALADRFVGWLDRIAEQGVLRLAWRRLRSWFGHRLVNAKLLEDELVVAEVTHSAVLYLPAAGLAGAGLWLLVRWLPFVEAGSAWFAAVVVLAALAAGFFRALQVARDRFVITDSRVFRVWGVLSLHEAEMEIGRVLDVTVDRPWWLRPFRSGHLVLENAAQHQGLREVRYVPHPDLLAKAIHRQRRSMYAHRYAGGSDT